MNTANSETTATPGLPHFAKHRAIPLLFVLAILAVITLFFAFGRDLTLTRVRETVAELKSFTDENPLTALVGFVAIYAILTSGSLPITPWLSITGGALFGSWLGTAASVTGATIGATVAMQLSRTILREPVRRRLGGRLDGINKRLQQDGVYYLLFLRVLPFVPFWVLNLKIGLTTMRTGPYVIITWLGLLPTTFLFVNAGANLATINSLSDVWTPELIVAFMVLGGSILSLKLISNRYVEQT